MSLPREQSIHEDVNKESSFDSSFLYQHRHGALSISWIINWLMLSTTTVSLQKAVPFMSVINFCQA